MRSHLFALALFFASCSSSEKPPETAEARAQLFVYSIINQNPSVFWESLDQPSKVSIAQLAGVSVDAPDVVQAAFSLSGRWRSLVSLKPIKAKAAADATEVTVTVESLAGEKMALQLLKIGDRWVVHLPIEQLTPKAPASVPASMATSAPSPASAPSSAPSSAPVK